ncbi:MAG: amidohydrolase [Acetobacteraceae bacterium]|nr:amidohydrolase [Acetobacteraceae bacterium]
MIVVKGGRVLTPAGGWLEEGTVVVEGGRIAAVGRGLDVPAGAEVIDAEGRFVTPGFIDAHSHLGLHGEPLVWATSDVNELTDPVTPQLRGMDGFNPDDPSFPEVLSAGVTAAFTGPGSANVVGGTGFAIKLAGRTLAEMLLPGTEAMKMALGENPKRAYGTQTIKKMPATRMGNAAVLREALVKAQNYMAGLPDGEEVASAPGRRGRDLRWEALGRVLRREIKARIHAHRADDILTALRIAAEFGLDCVIEHATEGYKVAEAIAGQGVPCTVGPIFIHRSKMELQGLNVGNAAALARAGVKVALQMDGASQTRWLPLAAGVAVREGMPEAEAFKAITIHPAEILGVAGRLGSLEPGKDADLAVFSGHPFCTFSHCDLVMVDGRVVYRRTEGGGPGSCSGAAYPH